MKYALDAIVAYPACGIGWTGMTDFTPWGKMLTPQYPLEIKEMQGGRSIYTTGPTLSERKAQLQADRKAAK